MPENRQKMFIYNLIQIIDRCIFEEICKNCDNYYKDDDEACEGCKFFIGV
ncbi:MAG: hypothetical protein ACXQS8_06420 [Candidatus Helarchaeales archaeon]